MIMPREMRSQSLFKKGNDPEFKLLFALFSGTHSLFPCDVFY